MEILVSGASGLIGGAVCKNLAAHGHRIAKLVRRESTGPDEVRWSPGEPLRPELVARFDAVLHFAGKNIACRWSEKAKREIRESRILGTVTLAEAVAAAHREGGRPHTFVSMSAIGYYGSRGDEELREKSAAGHGFLAELTKEWEAATTAAWEAGVRVVLPRLALVLSSDGGALTKMLPAFRLGLGGRIGSGRQYWSWISLEDVIGGVEFLLQQENLSGAFNFSAPQPVTNAEFTKTLAAVLHRPAIFPLPARAARLAMGASADELLLSSQRVLPERLLAAGYHFRDTSLREALASLLKSG